MMVVIVDPQQKTLTLLSIPRDSWVPLLFDGKTAVYNKVNTAYAFAQDPSLYPDRVSRYTGPQGPGNFAMDTVSRLLGIPITYYLGLDFQGFRDMISAVVAGYSADPLRPGPTSALVIDKDIIHHSKITNETLSRCADRLKEYRLPTYVPKLNVLECL